MAKKRTQQRRLSGNPAKRAEQVTSRSIPLSRGVTAHAITPQAVKDAERVERRGGPARMSSLVRTECFVCGSRIGWVTAVQAGGYGLYAEEIAAKYGCETTDLDLWLCSRVELGCVSGGGIVRQTELTNSIEEQRWTA